MARQLVDEVGQRCASRVGAGKEQLDDLADLVVVRQRLDALLNVACDERRQGQAPLA